MSFLRGRTSYGDSVEDEWLIVYLLRELSKQFPDAWVRVFDADGEFLLVEAANVLPPWLNPEVAEYRVSAFRKTTDRNICADSLQVWINGGSLLIIPMEDLSEKLGKKAPARNLNLQEAFGFIQDNRAKLIESALIGSEAFYRLQKYPQQIEQNLHNSVVTIPRKLAFVLHEKVAFISPAVEAFYLRDPIALRPLKAQDITKLVFPPIDLVTVSVKFTKVGYAQLKSQQFATPPGWRSYLSREVDTKTQSRVEMGMRVTSGFEMLMSDPQNIDHKSVREIIILLEDLETEDNCLPSDAEILSWEARDDDEGWLDVDFESFASELAGSSDRSQINATKGFGDKMAQDNLRKIVERFENFLNDDIAGTGGAENLDEMDYDNDEDESDSASEDQDVSFDEDQFASMMREMMGMPADTGTDASHDPHSEDDPKGSDKSVSSLEGREQLEILQAMQAMEAELQDAGALRVPPSRPQGKTKTWQPGQTAEEGTASSSELTVHESETDDGVEIDYNLMKNLLESFKSQGGAPGPGGNLIGLMGMRLPRDEDENH